jgi:2,3-bisphosphoglycerate-independent phosphoglycerate mutase
MFEVLSQHPLNKEREQKGLPTANIVLLRGCGSRLSNKMGIFSYLEVQSFKDLHGLNGCMIAPTAIINGLG